MRRVMMLFAAVATMTVVAGCDRDPAALAGSEAQTELSRVLTADFEQADRFGLPAIATVFIPTAKKDAYNAALPANDRRDYTADVIAVLTAFGHPDPAALAGALLPDIQPINTAQPTGFLNGRRLDDDVITAELGLIFGANAALNDDHVDANDVPFGRTFPYLAPPHQR